jgi:hypothetical protein
VRDVEELELLEVVNGRGREPSFHGNTVVIGGDAQAAARALVGGEDA